MTAYYNEIDPFCAQWLRNLIAAGLIAPGEVDDRSIAAVQPADVRGFTQCHFFAGIAAWSHALHCAGWPDERPIWTGSCPCQGFSVAGAGKGFDDERHLWPEFFRLIRECRPPIVAGEQVASPLALSWLDLVHDDLEGAGYAVGAADLCAASVGAPHIRQRLYWVALSNQRGLEVGRPEDDGHDRALHHNGREHPAVGATAEKPSDSGGLANAECVPEHGITGGVCSPQVADAERRNDHGPIGGGEACGMEHTNHGLHDQREGQDGEADERAEPRRPKHRSGGAGAARGLGNPSEPRGGRDARTVPGAQDEGSGERCGARCIADELVVAGTDGGLADADGGSAHRSEPQPSERAMAASDDRVLAGFWSDAIWLPCSDGKARPTQPGLSPLASGASGRVGKLRAIGNSLCSPVAQEFIEAVMECVP